MIDLALSHLVLAHDLRPLIRNRHLFLCAKMLEKRHHILLQARHSLDHEGVAYYFGGEG